MGSHAKSDDRSNVGAIFTPKRDTNTDTNTSSTSTSTSTSTNTNTNTNINPRSAR